MQVKNDKVLHTQKAEIMSGEWKIGIAVLSFPLLFAS